MTHRTIRLFIVVALGIALAGTPLARAHASDGQRATTTTSRFTTPTTVANAVAGVVAAPGVRPKVYAAAALRRLLLDMCVLNVSRCASLRIDQIVF